MKKILCSLLVAGIALAGGTESAFAASLSGSKAKTSTTDKTASGSVSVQTDSKVVSGDVSAQWVSSYRTMSGRSSIGKYCSATLRRETRDGMRYLRVSSVSSGCSVAAVVQFRGNSGWVHNGKYGVARFTSPGIKTLSADTDFRERMVIIVHKTGVTAMSGWSAGQVIPLD